MIVMSWCHSGVQSLAKEKLAPAEIQAELDRRQGMLDNFLKTEDVTERLKIADAVRKSEQLLLKQDIPA
jgi:hypothetical protein